MEVQANYIRRIEIHGLWNRYDIVWDLRPDVNILSGVNGVGKSTILNRVVKKLIEIRGMEHSINGVTITYSPEDANTVKQTDIDVFLDRISNYDIVNVYGW